MRVANASIWPSTHPAALDQAKNFCIACALKSMAAKVDIPIWMRYIRSC